MGEKFDRMTDAWTPEKLADFLERKYKLMTTGPGSICEVGKKSYAPFDDSEYPHREAIGDLRRGAWPALRAIPPATLLHPNPFEPSQIRTAPGRTCYRCWDSAIAIPACGLRRQTVYNLSNVPALREINTHWMTAVKQSFGHIGPLGPGGRILRPHGPYILDLPAMGEFGWTLREAAHVLGHLRGDSKPERTWILDRSKTGWHNSAALVELAYGLLFDVPIDVTDKDRGRPGEPDTYYGVELKSSSYVGNPLMRLPMDTREAPRVDETLAVMLFAVFTEPVPYGFLAKTGHRPEDRWSGGPSLVACVGWETIDYITHMPVGEFKRNDKSPKDYVMRGVDMLPPEDHWAYLALAKRDRPPPPTGPGSRWRYVREWLASEEYQALRAVTPPLPCEHCYMVNGDTEGAPVRPRGPHPKGPKKRWPPIWKTYYAELDQCIELGKKAVAEYEPLYYSRVDYPKPDDKKRRAAHNKKMKAIKAKASDLKALRRAQAKMSGKMHGALTERQYALYEQSKMEQDIESEKADPGR